MARSNIKMKGSEAMDGYKAIAEQGQAALKHYGAMHWNRVRKLAVEKGIPVQGRKKAQLVADLAELDQGA